MTAGGITRYGAYIPVYRLSRAEIAKAWGSGGAKGEKAIANYDEDSITMAVAAGMDCLRDVELDEVDGLFFASTTCPYKEKQSAAIIASALGLRKDILTSDFSNTLRAGTIALRSAIDTVASGSAKSVLVIAADTRMGYPRGEKEMTFGDGAAAILVGGSGIAVSIDNTYTAFNEFYETWRTDKDVYARPWEDRFLREAGYMDALPKAISSALERFELEPKDFSKITAYAPDSRQLGMVLGKAGFDPKTQVQDTLHDTVGNTGTALALMELVAALENAKAGDKILLLGYGDGCDIFSLKVTEEIEKIKDRRAIKRHLESKRMVPNYMKYMIWRGLVETEPAPRPPMMPVSLPATWRDSKWGLSLHGSKCTSCGTPQYPVQRVCVICQTEDEFEPYSFSRRKGKVFTFSHDNLAAAVDPPSTVTSVDFEGGGRIMCDMTDRDPEEVKTDMEVEMTFRKLHVVEGIHNYWWKCSPIRC